MPLFQEACLKGQDEEGHALRRAPHQRAVAAASKEAWERASSCAAAARAAALHAVAMQRAADEAALAAAAAAAAADLAQTAAAAATAAIPSLPATSQASANSAGEGAAATGAGAEPAQAVVAAPRTGDSQGASSTKGNESAPSATGDEQLPGSFPGVLRRRSSADALAAADEEFRQQLEAARKLPQHASASPAAVDMAEGSAGPVAAAPALSGATLPADQPSTASTITTENALAAADQRPPSPGAARRGPLAPTTPDDAAPELPAIPSPNDLNTRGRQLFASGDISGAISMWQQVLLEDHEHVGALCNLALALRLAGDSRGAERAATELLSLPPGRVDASILAKARHR